MANKKIILVTGGNGFIGHPTCKELLQNGYEVRVFDSLAPKDENMEIDYVQGRIEELDSVRKAMQGVYGVIHAAAMSRSGPSNNLWSEAVQSNVVGTSNTLLAAKEEGVKRFVYCGSSTYYGNQTGPQVETMPPDLLNVYGVTKFTGEEFTRIYDETFGLPTIRLRYFNVYGEAQPDDSINGLVIGIFLRAKSEGRSVVLDGGGLQTRDFVEVRDVARANRLAIESEYRNKVINIGSGEKTSIIELARMLNLNFSIGETRIGDAATTEADISNAKNFLKWVPEIDLETGLNDLIFAMEKSENV
jgi:nucleoside-diphosphate-sugar epimerase